MEQALHVKTVCTLFPVYFQWSYVYVIVINILFPALCIVTVKAHSIGISTCSDFFTNCILLSLSAGTWREGTINTCKLCFSRYLGSNLSIQFLYMMWKNVHMRKIQGTSQRLYSFVIYTKQSCNTRRNLILIYLLTAIELSPGGSTHLHTNNT
jgi:hypothetical protein